MHREDKNGNNVQWYYLLLSCRYVITVMVNYQHWSVGIRPVFEINTTYCVFASSCILRRVHLSKKLSEILFYPTTSLHILLILFLLPSSSGASSFPAVIGVVIVVILATVITAAAVAPSSPATPPDRRPLCRRRVVGVINSPGDGRRRRRCRSWH